MVSARHACFLVNIKVSQPMSKLKSDFAIH